MIKITVYKSGNKTKSMHCWSPDGYSAVANKDIFDIIREYPKEDFIFIDSKTKEDITYQCLINVLKTAEKNSCINHDNINKIIMNGGFVNYIKQLEK